MGYKGDELGHYGALERGRVLVGACCGEQVGRGGCLIEGGGQDSLTGLAQGSRGKKEGSGCACVWGLGWVRGGVWLGRRGSPLAKELAGGGDGLAGLAPGGFGKKVCVAGGPCLWALCGGSGGGGGGLRGGGSPLVKELGDGGGGGKKG